LVQLLVRVGRFLVKRTDGPSGPRPSKRTAKKTPAASEATDVARVTEFLIPGKAGKGSKISADFLYKDDTIGLLVALAALALAVVYGWRDANQDGGPPSPPSPPGGTPGNNDDDGGARFLELRHNAHKALGALLDDPDTHASAEELLELRARSIRKVSPRTKR
jgi:hypothetical protein